MKEIIARLLPVLAAGALVAGCTEDAETSPAGRRGGGRPGRRGERPAAAAIPVKAEPVEARDMVAYVETHARLEAERTVAVLGRSTGLVEQLLVEEGDRVRTGQVLARLEKEQLQLALQQSQVSLEQVRSSYDRVAALQAHKMVSEAEFDAARHQLANAQVRHQEVQLNLDYAEIRAPIPGVVMSRSVELGDLVRGNQELYTIADLEPLLARIHIPEKRIQQIREGQEARLVIESLASSDFTGRIRMISPGVDQESGTVKVTLEIPDNSRRLKPGMFSTVRIITDRHADALVIPKKALIIETDDDDVFIIEDGKAVRTRVELGFVEGDAVEVLAGLQVGQRVITVGHDGLKDGAVVRAIGEYGDEPAANDSTADGASSTDSSAVAARTGNQRPAGRAPGPVAP